MIKPFPLFMTMGQLQTLFSPQAFNLLMVNLPALNTKEVGDLALTVTAILLGQSNHRQTEFFVVMFFEGEVALSATR